jgi:hypothetical protein
MHGGCAIVPTATPPTLSAAARQIPQREYATIEITDCVAMMGGHKVALAGGYCGQLQNVVASVEGDVISGASRYHEMTAVLDQIAAGDSLDAGKTCSPSSSCRTRRSNSSHAASAIAEAATINIQIVTWRDGSVANGPLPREWAMRWGFGVSRRG